MGPFPEALGKLKFLIVAIDYFTKWIEAEVVEVINEEIIIKFIWIKIVCCFGLPCTIISSNGKQCAENAFKNWCQEKGIQQNFNSMVHPRANGQVELINRTLVKGIKKSLGKAKGNWVDELQNVLWAY